MRGGYGLFWAPWSSGVQSAIGYSQTTSLQQDIDDSDHVHRQPLPGGADADLRQQPAAC